MAARQLTLDWVLERTNASEQERLAIANWLTVGGVAGFEQLAGVCCDSDSAERSAHQLRTNLQGVSYDFAKRVVEAVRRDHLRQIPILHLRHCCFEQPHTVLPGDRSTARRDSNHRIHNLQVHSTTEPEEFASWLEQSTLCAAQQSTPTETSDPVPLPRRTERTTNALDNVSGITNFLHTLLRDRVYHSEEDYMRWIHSVLKAVMCEFGRDEPGWEVPELQYRQERPGLTGLIVEADLELWIHRLVYLCGEAKKLLSFKLGGQEGYTLNPGDARSRLLSAELAADLLRALPQNRSKSCFATIDQQLTQMVVCAAPAGITLWGVHPILAAMEVVQQGPDKDPVVHLYLLVLEHYRIYPGDKTVLGVLEDFLHKLPRMRRLGPFTRRHGDPGELPVLKAKRIWPGSGAGHDEPTGEGGGPHQPPPNEGPTPDVPEHPSAGRLNAGSGSHDEQLRARFGGQAQRLRASEPEWQSFMQSVSFFASYRLSTVYRNVVLVRGPGGMPAVIKAALTDEAAEELQVEWAAYSKLASLQGKQIPYAFAKGSVSFVIGELDAIAVEYIDGYSTRFEACWKTAEARLNILRLFESVWALGVVHGDVAPRNIAVRDSGEPVLFDFGRAVVNAADAQVEDERQQVLEMLQRNSDEDSGSVINWEEADGGGREPPADKGPSFHGHGAGV